MAPADPSLIGVTAKLAAYYRQFSDLPFAADAARLIGADAAFDALVREHRLDPDALAFYAPMFEARDKSLTALILATTGTSGAGQVLELAAGFSLRGLDLAEHAGIRYVETDLPGVIDAKRALLDDLRGRLGLAANPAHSVRVADALDLGALRAAVRDLDPRAPLVVVCEGLLLYLTREETARVAANARALLGDFAGGVFLTPDFVFEADGKDLPAERVRLREIVSGLTQRQLDAGAFRDVAQLTDVLDRLGFGLAARSQVDEAGSLASIAALGLPTSLVDRLRGSARVWVMTPR